MLIVEFNGESATCDLVTAARIRIRGRPVPIFNRGWVFDVLLAYQDDTSTPARLVLAGPGRRPASARDRPEAEQHGRRSGCPFTDIGLELPYRPARAAETRRVAVAATAATATESDDSAILNSRWSSATLQHAVGRPGSAHLRCWR